ncbi:hypothetical protein [uncultured Polaribacter sp.]|uniref:hypothetical protein n=1 Tax=uncultured Polaribacter sp. TaxID=174711 RepID=UPI0026107692|nr:hypothetical protein [uncultured Polaribacter sp.]
MKIKQLFLFLVSIVILSACSQDDDVTVARNLQEFIDQNANVKEAGVIACAANANANTNLVHIFYYPEDGATNVRYYELTSPELDKNNFSNYRRQSLNSESVFGGKLARFVRPSAVESWCLVTYFVAGQLRISEPIKLQSQSKTTEYTSAVDIAYKSITEPNFTWQDGSIDENIIYFQVISDEENNFISGTYTEDKFFQYYDTSNVVLNINTETPQALEEDDIYNFTMMGVSKDNWVNLIIEEEFIPRNLQEFVNTNTDKELADVLAFGASANGNPAVTQIYYQPVENAFDFRYYETENTLADPTDFSNYRRKNLNSTVVLGNEFRRFTNNSSDEVWCLVTYSTEDKLYISKPIKTKNLSKPTDWTTEIDINTTERLQPKFTWADGTFAENQKYLQIFTTDPNILLSGTFTEEKMFQYYNENNIIGNKIHTETPPNLILDQEYQISLFGLSTDNWVNLIIQHTFIAE